MTLFKLIVVAGDENRTGEYKNVVSGIKNAETKCSELLAKYINDYPDAYVACYEYDEDICRPLSNYLCWVRYVDGEEGWTKMKVGQYGRLGFVSK